ncbi:MAG: hypothetical protein JWR85_69 [Marmoricola sp.]|nr:hypothetical protein [Marmoricola sp.]
MSPKVSTDESKGSRKTSFAASQAAVRSQAARVVRLVFAALATILALGAVLVVLRNNINEQNSVVEFITNVADAVSGPFSRDDGIFDFTGKNAVAKNALLNWGIAAIVYLVIGRVLANAIAPKSAR